MYNMVRKSSRCKEGYIRVCTEIPNEMNNLFIELENLTMRKVNKSKIMYYALELESIKVKEELESISRKRTN
jgi:hypothetical protein